MSPANVTRAVAAPRPPACRFDEFESPPVNHGQAGTAEPMWAAESAFQSGRDLLVLPLSGATYRARVKTSASTTAAGRQPIPVWILITIGGRSRHRGSEPNVDMSFDCGPGPDYRLLLVDFHNVRHTLSIASPSGSRSPCRLGPARRRPFAGSLGHVGEMYLRDSLVLMPCIRKKIASRPPILTARHGMGSGAPGALSVSANRRPSSNGSAALPRAKAQARIYRQINRLG
jgi:hypothetical protein